MSIFIMHLIVCKCTFTICNVHLIHIRVRFYTFWQNVHYMYIRVHLHTFEYNNVHYCTFIVQLKSTLLYHDNVHF